MYEHKGEYEQALTYYQEALVIARELRLGEMEADLLEAIEGLPSE